MLLVVLIQVGALGAVLGHAVAREATTWQLERLRGWLVTHTRVVGIVLGLVVRALFTPEASPRSHDPTDHARQRQVRHTPAPGRLEPGDHLCSMVNSKK